MAAQRGAQGLDVDDFDLVLGTQWAARSRTLNPRHSGPAALAVALLLGAVRDAGLVRSHRTRRTAAQTALARRYLTGAPMARSRSRSRRRADCWASTRPWSRGRCGRSWKARRGPRGAAPDVIPCAVGEVGEYLLLAHSRREIFQHVVNRDPQATDARFATPLARLDCDHSPVVHGARLRGRCREVSPARGPSNAGGDRPCARWPVCGNCAGRTVRDQGGGLVDAPGRWLVGAKGEYPFLKRLSAIRFGFVFHKARRSRAQSM
jgi:hypothetical protein